MRKTVIASALIAASVILPTMAHANRKPAVQGGFDYAHSSGLYVGTWASNVSWLSDGSSTVSNSIEMDFYGGFKNTVGDFAYDVGLLQYFYPGSGYGNNPNTIEGYVAGTYSILTLKYSHSFSDLFGWADSKGSGYLDLTANYELVPTVNLVAHVGRQKVRGDSSGASYTDYKLGVTKDFSGTVVGLSYVNTNASAAWYTNAFGKDLGKDRVVLSITRTF